MQLNDILLMRQELFLLAIILLLLLVKIFGREVTDKSSLILGINILLILNLISGFFGNAPGEIFAGMFRTDFTLVMEKNLLNLGTLIIALQSYDWMKKHKDALEFYLILLCTLLGMFFMISSGHLLIFYLGLELASLPLAALVSFNRQEKRSAEAGLKMVLMSGFSTAILLFGVSMIYGITGTFKFSELSMALQGSPLEILAFIFIFSGFAFKISIVPFHLWTADVYEGAPISITSYLSVISKSAVVLIFITVLYKVFENAAVHWISIISVLSIITMTIGNLFALRQQNLKRFLAFSSIAQVGYILLGITSTSISGMSSVVYFILIYTFSNLGAFGVVSAISSATGAETLSEIKGLYKSNRGLALLLMLAMFSLAGVPPTAGFFGKFFLLTAAAGSKGAVIFITLAALNMVISLYYYLNVVKVVFVDTTENPLPNIEGSFSSKLSLMICGFGIIATGFVPGVFQYFYNLSFGM
jgi:NADH-quinone oxidoreductase subunit N